MRGWTILVLVVVGAWLLIVGPPAILEPSVRAVPHSLYDFIGWLYFTVFPYPGKWVLLHIWSGFFSLTLTQFFHGASWGSILVAVNYIGLLDELALFNRPLTAAEVALLHRTPGVLAPLKAKK